MYLIHQLKEYLFPTNIQQLDSDASEQGIGLPYIILSDKVATFIWSPWLRHSIRYDDSQEQRRSLSLELRKMASVRNLIGYVYLERNVLKFIVESK